MELTKKSNRITAWFMICALAASVILLPGYARARHHTGHYSRWRHPHPHVGAIFPSLPGALFATALIAGMTYYIIDDIYFHRCPQGYVVVEQPSPVVTANAPQAASTGSVVVTAGLLNVRSGPNINQPVIRQVPNGTVLPVWGSAPGWYYVQVPDNTYGWVMSNFTAPVTTPANG